MLINKLTRINEAPLSGTVLAYTRNRVIFEPYSCDSKEKIVDIVSELINNEELLELHLYDSVKEYRCVVSESHHHSGYIEHVSDFPSNDEEHVYKETVQLEKNENKQESITVLNHIKYDESGMVAIDDYRLVEEVNSNGE